MKNTLGELFRCSCDINYTYLIITHVICKSLTFVDDLMFLLKCPLTMFRIYIFCIIYGWLHLFEEESFSFFSRIYNGERGAIFLVCVAVLSIIYLGISFLLSLLDGSQASDSALLSPRHHSNIHY